MPTSTSLSDIQRRELSRVRGTLGQVVLDYCRQHATFCLSDLSCAVRQGSGAPDSPSRILRDLRQRGLLDYTVTNRRASAYRVDWTMSGNGRLF